MEADLNAFPSDNPTLQAALQYSTLEQGKRLRPALVYATGEALGIDLEKLDAAACAIELIHCYSLVHDDLPAMDDDDLRRGKPTCHIQFDESTAILVGDAQQTLAFEILAADTHTSAVKKCQMIQLLAQASGAQGMVAGQQFDLEAQEKFATLEELKQMHALKTGALLKCALHLGATQAESYTEFSERLTKFGEDIGLAFQVQDDILDIESDTETLGKPQGSDIENDKSTYPKFLGLEKTKSFRDELITDALQTLEQLPINNQFFVDLTRYIASRAH